MEVKKPIAICTADLAHSEEARAILSKAFDLRCVDPTKRELSQQIAHADAYFASLHVQLDRELIDCATNLKAIATPSTGLDHIDLEAAGNHNVAVLSLKNDRDLLDGITATPELAWGLVLACARHIPAAAQSAREGHWGRDLFRGHQIAFKTLGILGCGRIGKIMSQYAKAFRMNVIGHDLRPVELDGVRPVALDELLAGADILTIHVHLTQASRKLVGRNEIRKMKRGAILINTSRGAIIDEQALLEALDTGHLSAAGLDVIEGEWREDLANHPLIEYSRSHSNLIITPHIGGVTYESQAEAFAATARKLVDYFNEHRQAG